MKNLKNIFLLAVVALVGLSLTACSDDDLDTNQYNRSGVNIVAFGPSPILRTQEIRITGTNLTRVDKVLFPGDAAVEKSNFNSVTNKDIYVNVPDESVPGYLRLVAGNDTVQSITLLTFQEPIEVNSITPTSGLSAGDEITIKGDYVYNIAKVIFNSGVTVMAEDFTYTSRREIRVAIPLAAVSGDILLTDGDEWEMTWETPLEILTATISSMTPANADFGQQVTIKGTNFQTVQSVMFAGGASADFTVSDNNTTITATVPAECKSGAISLLLYSGDVLMTNDFSVPSISISNVEPNSDLIEGDKVTITGENFDRVKSVTLPGVAEPITNYTISGNTLTFTVPEGMTDGNVVLTQNTNISASAPLKIRKMAGVIWMGKHDLVSWSGAWEMYGGTDLWKEFNEVIKGAGKLTFHFKIIGGDPKYKIRMGDWGTRIPSAAPYEVDVNGDIIIIPTEDNCDLVLDLTADEANTIFGTGQKGLVIWGDGIQLQYVKFIEASDEIDISEACMNGDTEATSAVFPMTLSWSDAANGKFWIHRDKTPNLSKMNLKDGNSKIIFYTEGTGQCQFNDFNWSPYITWEDWNNPEPVKREYVLTQAMIDIITGKTADQWGTPRCFVIQGDQMKVTKVTILP